MPPGSARPALVYILFELLTEHDSETIGSERAQEEQEIYADVLKHLTLQNPKIHAQRAKVNHLLEWSFFPPIIKFDIGTDISDQFPFFKYQIILVRYRRQHRHFFR